MSCPDPLYDYEDFYDSDSDDGYDYGRDNRNGHVDDYVEFVEQWRKDREKNKDTPKSGD